MERSTSVCTVCNASAPKQSWTIINTIVSKSNGTQAVKMPDKDNNIVKFNNFHKQLPVPFVIYSDFEAITEKITTCKPNNNDSYTQSYQNHKDCGYTPAKFWPRSRRDLAAILARILASFWPARLPRSRRDLSEISKSRQPKTRRDSCRDRVEISRSRRDSRRDLGEIKKSRRPKTRRESRLDLGEISKSRRDSRRDPRISAAKNSPRFSPRSQKLSCQKLA